MSIGFTAAWVLLSSCGDSEHGSQAATGGAESGGAGGAAVSGSPGTGGRASGGASGGRTGAGGSLAGTGGGSEAGGKAETGGVSQSGGAGGAADAGSSAVPAGSAGEAGTLPDNGQYGACERYIVAQCARRETCGEGLSEHTCLSRGLSRCPDLFFAPGSRASIDAVEQCAMAWQSAACDEVVRGLFPDCGFDAGTFSLGTACLFDTQCETLACGRFGGDCGECVPLLNEGDTCSGVRAACPRGTSCDGTCQPLRPFDLPPDSPCEVVAQCQEGYVCRASQQGGESCQPLFEIGETCAASWECRLGYCDAGTDRCTQSPDIGMPCAEDGWGHVRGCAEGICDARSDPTECVARVGAGQACWVRDGMADAQGNCDEGLDCSCVDSACVERRCLSLRKTGESCGDASTACVAGRNLASWR